MRIKQIKLKFFYGFLSDRGMEKNERENFRKG